MLRTVVDFVNDVFQLSDVFGKLPYLTFHLAQAVEYFHLLVANRIEFFLKFLWRLRGHFTPDWI